jgi:ABC-type phosphate/phosphonate transport system substrate-binding protein
MIITSLPMYDLPELQSLTDDWWQGLASAMQSQGIANPPNQLSRADDDAAFWRRDDLLVSQTCGYPLMTEFLDHLKLIGTPHYDVPGCEGALYSSWIIVRADHPAKALADLRGGVCAMNSEASQSGMNALRHAVAPLAEGQDFFAEVKISGGHRLSVQMVTQGLADVAAIDCVTWTLIENVAPQELAGVRLLAQTAKAPGLPYVTAAATDDLTCAKLKAAVHHAVEDPTLADARSALKVCGFSETTCKDYSVILEMEREAVDLGYPVLR